MPKKIAEPFNEEDIITLSLLFNPLSARPYEVRIDGDYEKFRESEDAFKTRDGAFAYMSYLMHLHKDDVSKGFPIWIDENATPLATQEEYAAHRLFIAAQHTQA